MQLIIQILTKYIKIRFLYYFSQKFQLITKLIHQWFGINLTRRVTIVTMTLLTLLKYGFIGAGLFILIHIGKVYLSNWDLVCTYFLLLFLSPIVGNLGLVKRVLAPLDETLLGISPLSIFI
jgi:hypothetical protein